jgi:predicted transcriptional regulator YdeE
MTRWLVFTAIVAALAAGVVPAGASDGITGPVSSWANDADALPVGDPLAPRIVERPELILAGVVASGPDVSQMDFHGLWMRFQSESVNIKHQVDGAAYELHVQTEAQPPMHFAMAGVEVTKIEDLPPEAFVKVLPAATYAVFTMRFADGFAGVYERIWAWLAESPYTADPFAYDIQRYGPRFASPEDPESEVDIYVPVRLE